MSEIVVYYSRVGRAVFVVAPLPCWGCLCVLIAHTADLMFLCPCCCCYIEHLPTTCLQLTGEFADVPHAGQVRDLSLRMSKGQWDTTAWGNGPADGASGEYTAGESFFLLLWFIPHVEGMSDYRSTVVPPADSS